MFFLSSWQYIKLLNTSVISINRVPIILSPRMPDPTTVKEVFNYAVKTVRPQVNISC